MGPFKINLETNAQYLASDKLRFCPFCIEKGDHNVIQQFPFQDKCRIHGCRLIEVCPTCGEPIPYFLFPDTRVGISCSSCGKQLISRYKGHILVAADAKREETIYSELEFNMPSDIQNIVIFDTKVHPSPKLSEDFKAFMNDLIFDGTFPEPDMRILKRSSARTTREEAEGHLIIGTKYNSDPVSFLNSVLEKNGTGEDKPCFYDLKISEDAVEQVCAYIYAMNSAKLSRRMLPRKFSEIDYIVSSKLKDIKLDYPYCRDEIEQFIKHRYLSDIYDEAYEVFMMQPYNGKDIYLDRLVPVLDYEIVIVEHFEMVDIFLFKTLTNGMKYESFFKESSKHVSGYKPF